MCINALRANRMKGERQPLQRRQAGRQATAAAATSISELKSGDVIQDNSIYCDLSTNARP